ncbi:DNA primase small subunit [Augochlora pura]
MADVQNLTDLLPTYYNRLFPFYDFYRWLSYGSSNTFSRREFSFTLNNDVYIRYLSFATAKDMLTEVKRLVPIKMDIGAVYNYSPKENHKGIKFKPTERELVFDIDMTDYDDIRTCCSGTDICGKCWKYLAIACKVIDSTLRLDFGYKNILWVFSGRRGIHCWVCDASARKLDSYERSALVDYIQVLDGGEHVKKKVNLPAFKNIHHSIRRALEIIEPLFVPFCVEEQNMLGTEEGVNKFLQLFSDEMVRKLLKSSFSSYDSSKARWTIFLHQLKHGIPEVAKKWAQQQRNIVEEIMIQYAYPRLDINVTKGMNHLLKAPFCVHPKTGKVCVPLTANVIDKFEPDKAPTITSLIEEINQFDAKSTAEKEAHNLGKTRIKDYKKTSLNKSMRLFLEFLWNLEVERKGQIIQESDATMEF